MIYITSDFHFCHQREFLYGPRGFSSVEEMNIALVENYNNIITPEDTVYILGDCMLNNDKTGIALLSQLKGHKYLAIGNHDSDARIEKYRAANLFEDIQFAYRFNYHKWYFYATHYPTITYNPNDKRRFCLCGHSHTKDKFSQWDVGCYHCDLDAHENAPVSIEQIIEDIKHHKEITNNG